MLERAQNQVRQRDRKAIAAGNNVRRRLGVQAIARNFSPVKIPRLFRMRSSPVLVLVYFRPLIHTIIFLKGSIIC
jgi:hypothetical protein